MAEAVAAALKAGETLICEAGTGTGKTFAYLVPALLSGRKVLVSTGTRNLQDQLFHRETLRRQLLRVRDWAAVTRSGDVAELDLPEDVPVWPAVTSNSDNCLGQSCPKWGRCHLIEAQSRAQGADLVVINHICCARTSRYGTRGSVRSSPVRTAASSMRPISCRMWRAVFLA